jgi:hypothetical protein
VPKQDRKAGSGKIGEASGRGMVDLNPPRGTRDFFPDDKRLQNWLFGEFAAVSRLVAVHAAQLAHGNRAGNRFTSQRHIQNQELRRPVWFGSF